MTKSTIGISKEYFKAFFGVRISVSADRVAAITSLPYVKAVHYDREVKATLEKSIPQIGADQVWQSFGNQGSGVKVGIIDTGIDYLHPALGGGIGSTFKVVGGFDFVNGDSDPMDDNGHGTHVAGIVSANSQSMKGVAPQSKLYAYKVLNENGNGMESDIISAVEMVVDPNNDGDTSDHMDIVNMSLGSDGGTPFDASAVAVNNASKLGVLFVVAAGNAGYGNPVPGKENNYYYNGSATIGSPGTAELALTVGAVDSLDQLGWFSSKGPNSITFSIKPEIVAPGVQIHSTFLASSTERLNGTSMATPMVTGVAALLKSINPGWSNERVKSAIINSGKDVGLSAYKQGGGRVQAFKAASNFTWINPQVLNLGLDDPSVGTWIRKDTLYLYNSKNTLQNYSTSVAGNQSGISIALSPSGFSVPAGGSAQVVVTTTVNNSTIPVVADDIPLYSGRIAFYGSADTISVPWAFARATKLTLTFNEYEPYFFGISPTNFIFGSDPGLFWVSPTQVEMYGYRKDTYDFFALFASPTTSKIYIKENVLLNSDAQTVNITSLEATVPVVYQSKDHNGNPLASYPSIRRALVTTIPNWGDQTGLFEQSSDTLLVSPASSRFKFRPVEYHFDPVATRSAHITQYSTFTGMSVAKTLTNNPSEYVSQTFKFQFPPKTTQGMIVGEYFAYQDINGDGFLTGLGYDIDTIIVMNDEYSFKGYFHKSQEPLRDVGVAFHTLNSIDAEYLDLSTFPVMAYNDSIIALPKDNIMTTVPRSPNGGTISFGVAPITLTTVWYNNWFGANTLHFNTLFRGVHRETRFNDVDDGTYSVFTMNGDLVFSNPLNDFPREPKELSAQWYKMVITSGNYWLRNKKGKIVQTSEFNLGETQASPPSVTAFLITNSQGQPVNSFAKGESGSLIFSAEVIDLMNSKQVNPDSTKAWYRIHGTASWLPLPVNLIGVDREKEGTIFKADLASALAVDSVAIDLRVFVKDSVGYTNDFQISPAFVVGNWISNDPNDVEDEPEGTVPKEFSLSQNYPNPFNPSTTIRFGIPHQSAVQVEIFNILGQRVELFERGTLAAGYHTVHWTANVPSGVYFYRITAEGSGGRFSQTKKMMLLR
ncbi:MAG: S8 family serine peptidase [Bacteroidota bacterium]